MAESRAKYQSAQAPKPTYVDRSGQSHTIDPGDARVTQLRRELDQQKWVNRQLREQTRYGNYYTNYATLWPTGVYYRDPYSNYFWLWLLAQSLDTRASFAYNHYDAIDQARYRDLLSRDANLEARIQQLEAEKSQRNPTYVPEGIDADLMYNDNYVDAVYNPTPNTSTASTGSSPGGSDSSTSGSTTSIPHSGPSSTSQQGPYRIPDYRYAPYTPVDPNARSSSAGGTEFLHTMFTLVMFGLILAAIIWLVFFKRWGGDDKIGRW